MDVEGYGRLSVDDGLLDVAWFLFVQVGWFVGGVGGQKDLCGSRLIRVTSMHYIESIRMFGDAVTSPEHALVIQGGSLGVWVG